MHVRYIKVRAKYVSGVLQVRIKYEQTYFDFTGFLVNPTSLERLFVSYFSFIILKP